MPSEPDTPASPSGAGLPTGRFSGREAFRQQVRDALACAAHEGWREIIVCDAGFEDWPLGERVVAESLQAWSKTGRRFTMLARNFDHVVAQHPRFVTWRRTWSHIIDCHACRSADPLELPSTIWSAGWMLQRLEVVHCTGVSSAEPARSARLRAELDEWLHRSTPAFPATTLGL